MFKTTVKELLNKALEERTDLFLIEMTISEDNRIKIIIDGDKGVSVEDCMFVSRAIEHNLDREETDFALEVASAGATSPIVNNRQYNKNIGRTLEVKTTSDNIEGILKDTSDEGISLEWKVREPKPVGKGKVTVKKEAVIAYSDIVEAKVMIKF
ncbi:ribosome maturation factor RimP [Yeosuana aromativorans]|uniref:Ribosome maturation factor RimP n=1 Tax=Yeosuana aromativorans TaxID=288019 RepID=A0A8J3BD48_9FLAO|nr:ribosome assembly cofactor RimP [Yeosuana aromativorans]GGK12878.1 ribosome maturation factor RimP [Yeosuana aromativorans]